MVTCAVTPTEDTSCRTHLPLARPVGSTCNDAIGIDRVALMFLSLERLPQDAVWAAWLDGASGMVPLQLYQVLPAPPVSPLTTAASSVVGCADCASPLQSSEQHRH